MIRFDEVDEMISCYPRFRSAPTFQHAAFNEKIRRSLKFSVSFASFADRTKRSQENEGILDNPKTMTASIIQ